MSVWKAEITFDNITASLPDPATLANSYPVLSYLFVASDRTFVYRIGAVLVHDKDIVGPGGANAYWTRTLMDYSVQGNYDPADPWAQIATAPFLERDPKLAFHQIDTGVGDAGTRFDAAGTFSIVKDTDLGTLTWNAPGGSFSVTLAFIGTDASEMRPISYGLYLQPLFDQFSEALRADLVVGAHDFWGSLTNGHFTGAAMTQADPGVWDAWKEVAHGGAGFNLSAQPFQQLVSEFRAELTWPDAPGTSPASGSDYWYRPWLGPDRFPTNSADSVVAREHGTLFGIYFCNSPLSLCLRRSYDGATSWAADQAVTSGGTLMNPAVTYWAGIILVVYDDGANLKRTVSRDGGWTWSTPVSISIAGTNPRLLVLPDGMQFYFYISGGNLLLQRSFDQGNSLADSSPITVATAIGAQTVGAVLLNDGSILVSYILTNAWINQRSRDLGVTWVQL